MKRIEVSERARTATTAPLTVPNFSFRSATDHGVFPHTGHLLPVTFRETLVEGLRLKV